MQAHFYISKNIQQNPAVGVPAEKDLGLTPEMAEMFAQQRRKYLEVCVYTNAPQ